MGCRRRWRRSEIVGVRAAAGDRGGFFKVPGAVAPRAPSRHSRGHRPARLAHPPPLKIPAAATPSARPISEGLGGGGMVSPRRRSHLRAGGHLFADQHATHIPDDGFDHGAQLCFALYSARTRLASCGGSGKIQPRFWMIALASSGGMATISSGSMEKRPVKPPMALRACTPE